MAPSTPARRTRRLPALALPRARESRREGAVFSIAFHLLLILLLVTPFAVHHVLFDMPQGAGGPGPAGGGGGGHGGTGGASSSSPERLQFIVLPRVQPPVPVSVVTPPQPVVAEKKPEPPKVEPPKVEEIKPPAQTVAPAPIAAVAAIPGTGGGSGHDGTNGNGPGTGGGLGSGVGTGRGSGVGPGTGGGTQTNYPPTPTELFMPPMPVPDDVRGFHLIAEYEVDATGKIVSFDFTPTKNRGYNKQLEEVLRSVRFRPGTSPDGTPIRMKTQITYDLF